MTSLAHIAPRPRPTRDCVDARLEPGLDAPHTARGIVTETLRRWQLDRRTIDDARLATSELVTHAVEHGEGPVSLRIERLSASVRVEVRDGGGGLTSTPGAARAVPLGAALTIVDRIATRWGVRGSALWAELRARAT